MQDLVSIIITIIIISTTRTNQKLPGLCLHQPSPACQGSIISASAERSLRHAQAQKAFQIQHPFKILEPSSSIPAQHIRIPNLRPCDNHIPFFDDSYPKVYCYRTPLSWSIRSSRWSTCRCRIEHLGASSDAARGAFLQFLDSNFQ